MDAVATEVEGNLAGFISSHHEKASLGEGVHRLASLLVREKEDFSRHPKEDATSPIDDTAKAHEKWKAIKDHEATRVFLVALLVQRKGGSKDKAPVAKAEQR